MKTHKLLYAILSFGLVALFVRPQAAFAITVPDGCDYLIITDSLLLPQAQRLATMRANLSQSAVKKPTLVTMADIYAAYPISSTKYKSLLFFLKDLYKTPEKWPKYLVLFGDASENETSNHNHVPTFVYRAKQNLSDTIPVSADDVYTCLKDSLNDTEFTPKIIVGRIPAHTLMQATHYVDKVIQYETKFAYGPKAFTYGFLADDDKQLIFPEPIQGLVNQHEVLWNRLKIKPFVRRTLEVEFQFDDGFHKNKARDSLISMWNSGLSDFYYVGHGHFNQLTDEAAFQIPRDLNLLSSNNQNPIVSLLACTTSPFVIDSIESIGESLLFNPYGAIAVLGAVEETYPTPNLDLFSEWIDSLGVTKTIGEGFQQARI